MSWQDLTDVPEPSERRTTFAVLLLGAAFVVVALFMLGADGDDSLNGCPDPNCEVGEP